MLILITAPPGSFKTAKGATLAKQYAKEGRPVYHNINGLNGDGLQPLPENDDWTTTPDGSVIIYDEAQMIDFFQYKGREKLSTDHRIKNLETHRHTGHDIILITQSPSFIHNHVLSLVGEHYHLHRAYGRAYADVFLWRYVSHTPHSTTAKNKAESHTKFKPDKTIFDEYKSTTIDTHKLKIPPIFFKLGAFLLLVIAIVSYVVFGSDNPFLSASKIKENAETANGSTQTTPVASPASLTNTPNGSPSSLDIECRKGINVEKPECVQWFNDLGKNGSSVTGDSSENTLVFYEPSKPYDQAHIQQKISYEVTSKPVFSGCMKKNGKYVALTQQGTILDNVSSEDCKRLIENGDRPYNYFAQPTKPDEYKVQADTKMTPDQYHSYLSYIAREQQQANNYVEPHLQRSVTNGANPL